MQGTSQAIGPGRSPHFHSEVQHRRCPQLVRSPGGADGRKAFLRQAIKAQTEHSSVLSQQSGIHPSYEAAQAGRPVDAADGRCYLPFMVDASFNTKANIQTLQESGIENRQARAITEVVRAGLTDNVASMADLAEIKNDVLWIKRIGSVLVALGVAATGFLYSEIGFVREELRTEIGSVRTEISSVREELRTEIGSVRTEISSVREELRTEISSVREELRTEISSVRTEIGSVRTEISSLRNQIQANGATLARIEATLNERLPRD